MTALTRYELCPDFHLIGVSCKSRSYTHPFAAQERIKHQSGIRQDVIWPTPPGLCTPRVRSTRPTEIRLKNVIVPPVCLAERILRAEERYGWVRNCIVEHSDGCV